MADSGWVRTVGGVDGYLSIHARPPAARRAAIHAAPLAGDLRLTPAARGCIYLVPASQAPLALALARDQVLPRERRTQERAGVDPAELVALGEAVAETLASGPMGTAALRAALPATLIRSLGEVGKKLGLSSTLPPALRELEFAGRIVRVPTDGRLDTERYDWALTPEDAETVDRRPAAQRNADIAGIALAWLAPIDTRGLADFLGWTQTETKAALKACGALPVAVEGAPAWMLPKQRAQLDAPPPMATVLLPAMDTLLAWHGGPAPFLHHDDLHREVPVWGPARRSSWAEIKHPLARVVLASGQVCGRWEYDPERGDLALLAYAPGLPADIAACATRTARFIREELGHGRTHSLEKDAQLVDRCARLRSGQD